MTNINDALTAIIDFATALRDASDSSIDAAQYPCDAIFDMMPADLRESDDPAPIDRDALDDLDRASFDALLTAYIALLDSRP